MIEDQKLEELQRQILVAEENLEAAKRTLFELKKVSNSQEAKNQEQQPIYPGKINQDGTIIEGFFNGENMVAPNGKIYPVPANYASKSKLVEGDGLKLTIGDDGSFVFKQISPVRRKSLRGLLKFENNAYNVIADGHSYKILYASVTYHKGKPGDMVTIVVPADKESGWAVLESIIHDTQIKKPEDTNPQESIQAAIPTNESTTPTSLPKIEEPSPISQPNLKVETPINPTEDIKDRLKIEEVNINPIKKNETPDSVNPAEIPGARNLNKTVITPPSAVNAPPENVNPISEMDI